MMKILSLFMFCLKIRHESDFFTTASSLPNFFSSREGSISSISSAAPLGFGQQRRRTFSKSEDIILRGVPLLFRFSATPKTHAPPVLDDEVLTYFQGNTAVALIPTLYYTILHGDHILKLTELSGYSLMVDIRGRGRVGIDSKGHWTLEITCDFSMAYRESSDDDPEVVKPLSLIQKQYVHDTLQLTIRYSFVPENEGWVSDGVKSNANFIDSYVRAMRLSFPSGHTFGTLYDVQLILMPSEAPSRTPSDVPSVIPSYFPTNLPSSLPSQHPTSSPSMMPTLSQIPSHVPTFLPSNSPSLSPTLNPSVPPSNAPTSEYLSISNRDKSQNVFWALNALSDGTLYMTIKGIDTRYLDRIDIHLLTAITDKFLRDALRSEGYYDKYQLGSVFTRFIDVSGRIGEMSPDDDEWVDIRQEGKNLYVQFSVEIKISYHWKKNDVIEHINLSRFFMYIFAEHAESYLSRLKLFKGQISSAFMDVLPYERPSTAPSEMPSKKTIPTKYPSYVPTEAQSSVPSHNPSHSPAGTPSNLPSIMPLKAPSYKPSDKPLTIPSAIPSNKPSRIVSEIPSVGPTYFQSRKIINPYSITSILPASKSISPSRKPSMIPSEYPTTTASNLKTNSSSGLPLIYPPFPPIQSRTKHSTRYPLGVPNEKPSELPRKTPDFPSMTHTNVPRIGHIEDPTDFPTIKSSKVPTLVPNPAPITKPRLETSQIPSKTPSEYPSYPLLILPLLLYSNEPSVPPTQGPTPIPSRISSGFSSNLHSTSQPSEGPSQFSTNIPSKSPSEIPSDLPSMLPTPEPTTDPSQLATNTPSEMPSGLSSDFPSIFPTPEPTLRPSHVPTLIPSRIPSNFPSQFPSMWPTVIPTLEPSQLPTKIPSTTPTYFPTHFPSVSPTNKPTMEPTLIPSLVPSAIPSDVPTNLPSILPTDEPTVDPTKIPTSIPSQVPSNIPSRLPSDLPTDEPSLEPSYDPTNIPSQIPSKFPSRLPSGFPTNQPSLEPSYAPTNIPSDFPSDIPSNLPSMLPSNEPSKDPSQVPTTFPSEHPSDVPTYLPSIEPTNLPSVRPSQYPTNIPSEYPSDIPSFLPSMLPTSKPSGYPSHTPTQMPSELPSNMPTTMPSHVPSNFPSLWPSTKPSAQPTYLMPNLSCHDDLSYRFRGRRSWMCLNWVQKDPEFLCRLFDFANTVYIYQMCPFSCGVCYIGKTGTRKPTNEPTARPSEHPSIWPSEKPSGIPSFFPSNQPSLIPSDTPTMIPSSLPSRLPSKFPSMGPTKFPSVTPSNFPSLSPSESPSEFPTKVPSHIPSFFPSRKPSFFPSANPNENPSQFPSKIPSAFPSSFPSHNPSDVPSWIPSIFPSGQPSLVPSVFPTFIPSQKPTSYPVKTPSGLPTLYPSSIPSEQPSLIPSSKPSNRPSSIPTNYPSHVPSTLPSDIPSFIPSQIPSTAPSDVPSNHPTDSPSRYPSNLPTKLPTEKPSKSSEPSAFPSFQPTACDDDSTYSSRYGFPCTFHTKIDCKSLVEIGFTNPQVGELIDRCPRSCGFCRTISPSTIPSIKPTISPSEIPSLYPSLSPINPSVPPTHFPSIIPSNLPSLSPTQYPTDLPSFQPTLGPTSCQDNPNFQDRYGFLCDVFLVTPCEELSVVGYHNYEILSIMSNCKKSCGYCPEPNQTFSPSFHPSNYPVLTNIPSFDLTDYPSIKSQGLINYPSISPASNQTLTTSHLNLTFFSNASSTIILDKNNSTSNPVTVNQKENVESKLCEDDLLYLDSFGNSCNSYSIAICLRVAYDTKLFSELYSRCPKSCGLCSLSLKSGKMDPKNLVYVKPNQVQNDINLEKSGFENIGTGVGVSFFIIVLLVGFFFFKTKNEVKPNPHISDLDGVSCITDQSNSAVFTMSKSLNSKSIDGTEYTNNTRASMKMQNYQKHIRRGMKSMASQDMDCGKSLCEKDDNANDMISVCTMNQSVVNMEDEKESTNLHSVETDGSVSQAAGVNLSIACSTSTNGLDCDSEANIGETILKSCKLRKKSRSLFSVMENESTEDRLIASLHGVKSISLIEPTSVSFDLLVQGRIKSLEVPNYGLDSHDSIQNEKSKTLPGVLNLAQAESLGKEQSLPPPPLIAQILSSGTAEYNESGELNSYAETVEVFH